MERRETKMDVVPRSQFEEEQLNNTETRLATIKTTIDTEETNLQNHEQTKETIEEELEEFKQTIETLKDELKELNEDLEEKTKVVEQVKKKAAKSAKALDQVLKEIGSNVSPVREDMRTYTNGDTERWDRKAGPGEVVDLPKMPFGRAPVASHRRQPQECAYGRGWYKLASAEN